MRETVDELLKKERYLYALYKANNVCPRCGVNSLAPGKASCEECLAKTAERKRKKRAEDENFRKAEIRKNQVYQRHRREKYRELGVCIECGKPLANGSTCYCQVHQLQNRRHVRKQKEKYKIHPGLDRTEYPSYGYCYYCGKEELYNGTKLCKGCYDKQAKKLEKAMDSPKTKQYRKQSQERFFRLMTMGKGVNRNT